jgi:hypothetical protein
MPQSGAAHLRVGRKNGWTISTEECTVLYVLEVRYDNGDTDRIQEPRVGHAEPG